MVCQWNCNSCEKGDPGTSRGSSFSAAAIDGEVQSTSCLKGIHGDKELVPLKDNGIQMFVVGFEGMKKYL